MRSQTCLSLAIAGVLALTVATPLMAKRLWVPMPTQKAEAMQAVAHEKRDLEQGAKLFERCIACHAVGDARDTGIGPHLNDVVGRRAASVTGFDYSKDMSRAGEEGLVWTPEFLSDYLRRPETFLPETKMAFSGISDAAEREALIAYLETLNQRAERLIEAANETESGPPVVDYGDTE